MAKGKKSKLKSALKNIKHARAQQVSRQKAIEHLENQQRNAAKVENKGKQKHRLFFPYKLNDHILLIGEGNFSFAHALAKKLGSGKNITATAYDSQQSVMEKYSSDAKDHISRFTELGGTVHFDVDAMDLHAKKELRGKRFTKIVFNFPHAGAGIKDQDRNVQTNQRLLVGFFQSAQEFLTDGVDTQVSSMVSRKRSTGDTDSDVDEDDDAGEMTGNDETLNKKLHKRKKGRRGKEEAMTESVIEFEGMEAHVTYGESDPQEEEYRAIAISDSSKSYVNQQGEIHVSLKSGPPYSLWNVRQLAKDCSLRSSQTMPFDLRAYPGYEHRRTLGFKDGVSKDANQEIRDKNPKLYAFVRKTDSDNDSETDQYGQPRASSNRTKNTRKPRNTNTLGITSESLDYKTVSTLTKRRRVS